MTGKRASLVWTERRADAKALMALPDAPFTEELRRRFGTHLGAVAPVGPRWSYPLSLQIAREYIAPRLALVGDAAHAIHPIAGQGFNLGLRDVAALAEILIDARRLGLDIGAPTVLEKYQRWRRFDNVALTAATDVLNRLFSNDLGPVRLGRDLGLAIVGRIAPARRMFMRHAGGVLGLTPESLPRLLRGEAP
jgi:2-octaprenyl-6-methoxyphenol hydroxylase